MRCGKCGANLPDGALFCGNCGTKFSYNVCRRCGAPLRPVDRVCRNCGLPTGMTPPKRQGQGQDQIVLFVAIGIAAAVAFTMAVVAVFFVFNHNSSGIAKASPTPVVTTPEPAATNPPTEQPAPTPQIVYIQGQNPPPAAAPAQPAQPAPRYGSYIFPTDSVYLTTSDLAGRSRDQVRLMLNEIYARHGYIFSTDYYRNYFSSQPWYVPVSSDESYITSQFNSIERSNKEFIASYERSMGWR